MPEDSGTTTVPPAVPAGQHGAPGPALRRERLPGDPEHGALIDRMLRVDHAGEYGACRIYAGQMAVLGRHACAPALATMAAQERHHLETFERMVGERRVRPTALQPLWHLAGFALGAGTALKGSRAAMACTVAVEEAIDTHYRRQAAQLGPGEAPLKATIERFRAEEDEHRRTGLAHGAEQAVGYPLMRAAIKAGSRVAIWLSERI
jgi:ubiquinone biosynthesis monooxygenase Coq7